MDPAAPQHQLGQPVVDVGGPLDDPAAVADDLVGLLQVRQCLAGLGEQVRGVDGGGSEGCERAEQRDLFPLEDPRPAVGREQDADDVRPEHEGHAEDRHQALVPYTRVDGRGVLEAVVLEVVVGDVGAGGLGDESAEALPHAEPQLLEARRDRSLGDPHVRVALGRVVQAQVRDVRAQQGAGALHDRLEHGVEVAQPRQVVGRLEERGQLGLASATSLHLRAHTQREELGALQSGDPVGRQPVRAGEQHRLLVRVGGRAPGQQLQERRLGARLGALGGLQLIARHVHQDYPSHRQPDQPCGQLVLSARSSHRRGPVRSR